MIGFLVLLVEALLRRRRRGMPIGMRRLPDVITITYGGDFGMPDPQARAELAKNLVAAGRR